MTKRRTGFSLPRCIFFPEKAGDEVSFDLVAMLLQLDRIGNHFSTLAFSKLISYNSYKSESVFGCIWSGVIYSMLLFYLFKQPLFFFPQNKSSFLFFCSFPFTMLELFLKLIYIDPLKVKNQMQELRGAPAKKPAPDYFL